MKYEMPGIERELCDNSTIKRMTGGANFKAGALADEYRIPQLAPLAVVVNNERREAELLVRVRVVEAPSGAKVKVDKGAPLAAGMFLCDGENTIIISTVDTTNDDYDEIEATASITGFKLNSIAFEATDESAKKPKGVATHLNYAYTSVKKAKENGITPIYRAFEVRESKLYIPLTKEDKKSLKENGVFVFTY